MKRKICVILFAFCTLAGCSESGGDSTGTAPRTAWEAAEGKTDIPTASESSGTSLQTTTVTTTASLLTSAEDIGLHDIDGEETNYVFTYDDEKFSAIYTADNWHITDSYKITDKNDITLICKALTDIHPIHTKDRKSYRTAESLSYEWQEHNSAYEMLAEGSEWKDHVKDVDLDPEDEGKSMIDMALDRLNAQNEQLK